MNFAFGLIILMTLVGLTILVLRTSRQQVAVKLDWLERTGARLGLEGVPQSDRSAAMDRVDGVLEGVPIRIGTRTYGRHRDTGVSSFRDVTIVRAQFDPPLGLGLNLVENTPKNSRNLAKLASPVDIGDPRFEDAFVVRASNGDAPGQAERESMAELILGYSSLARLTMAGRSFSLKFDGSEPPDDQLDRVIEAVVNLHQAFDKVRT